MQRSLLLPHQRTMSEAAALGDKASGVRIGRLNGTSFKFLHSCTTATFTVPGEAPESARRFMLSRQRSSIEANHSIP